nr:hypothetical protein HK105_003509 [Polyrhizophydium stewartii]
MEPLRNGDTEHNHDTVGLQRQLEESRSAVSRLEEKVAQLRSSEVQLRIRLELVQGDLAIKNDEVRELTRLRSKAAIYEANDSQIRALLARQDALVSELDKMRRFHETYNELIQKVEAAAAAGKVCLVSAKGSAVLTMEELRREIIRSVALD